MQVLLRLLLCAGAFALAAAADETTADNGVSYGEEASSAEEDGSENHDHAPGSPEEEAANKIEDASSDDGSQPPESFTDEQLKGLHAKIDKNGDGKMSMDEIMAFWKVTRQSMAVTGVDDQMEVLDHDKDGKVSLAEYSREQDREEMPEKSSEAELAREKALRDNEEAKFKLADANSDGFLDRTEVSHLTHPEAHDGMLNILSAHTVKSKDTNGDGELSPEEFWDTAGTEPMDPEDWNDHLGDFKGIDLDGNGKLNVEEISDWEGGAFHTRRAFEQLLEIVDDDKDGHFTLDELAKHEADIGSTDATMHFSEWAEHHEL